MTGSSSSSTPPRERSLRTEDGGFIARGWDRDRAAVHTGEFEFVGDDMVGVAVHEAARVAAVATEGEVLVSAVTRDLAGGVGLSFEDRGSTSSGCSMALVDCSRSEEPRPWGFRCRDRADRPRGQRDEGALRLVDLEGVHVLEIGAGDGRLTWRYAERTAHVTAVEPFEGSVSRAREQLRDGSPRSSSATWRSRTSQQGAILGVFDVALLSWSLY